MCHGYTPDWDSSRADDREDDPEEESDPTFAVEESSTDTELLTDGGDDE